jgi:hypothetical protein
VRIDMRVDVRVDVRVDGSVDVLWKRYPGGEGD